MLTGGATILKPDYYPWPLFGDFIGTFLLSSLLTVPFALGEELGWRGYLQPKLTQRLGIIKGLVAVGLIAGLWHAPLILLGDGIHFMASPILGALLFMPLQCVALSGVLGWLRMRSGSIWPAVLAHGAYNSLWPLAMTMQPIVHPMAYYAITTAIFLLFGIGFMLAAQLRAKTQVISR